MATLVSIATGNFTASATWGVADTTSYLDSEAASTAVSTSNLDSATFTPGAITIDRILVKLANRATSPSGTFTVTLRNSTDAVDVDSVTVNVSDLPFMGWVCFNIGSNTLIAGKAYLIRVVCSATGSQVTLYRNSTANNWSRILVTTTTGAPAAGDQLVIVGEWTAAATGTDYTVTMNNTATTSFGPTVSGGPPQGVTVNNRGVLTCGTSASTNYYFKWKGQFVTWGGGVTNFGTSSGRIPSTSTLTLHMDVVTNMDTKLVRSNGGTLNVYGATKTCRTALTADVAASGTVLTLGSTTGWLATDQLGVCPTSSASASSRATISTVDSGTQVTLTGGIANAHTGTGEIIATVLNLSRNIKIQGNSTALRCNILLNNGGSGNVTLDSVELVADYFGLNSTNNRMIDFQDAGNYVLTLKDVSINPVTEGAGNNNPCLYISSGSANNFVVDGLSSWRWIRQIIVSTAVITTTGWEIKNCTVVRQSENTAAFELLATYCNLVDNEFWGCVRGLQWSGNNSLQLNDDADRFSGNKAYHCSQSGFQIGNAVSSGAMSVFRAKDCVTKRCFAGWDLNVRTLYAEITNHTSIGDGGNSTQGACFRCTLGLDVLKVIGGVFADDDGNQTNQFLTNTDNANSIFMKVFLYSVSLGQTSGVRADFNDCVFRLYNSAQSSIQAFLFNCLIGSVKMFGTGNSAGGVAITSDAYAPVVGDHALGVGSFARCQNYHQSATDHRTYTPQGVLQSDAVIYNVAAPSLRMTPGHATYKLTSSYMLVPVASGDSATISVAVRKSSSADAGGADYNGNQPRLIVKANAAAGIASDTVLDTMSAGLASWETLTGVTATVSVDCVLEVIVDCDGTAGWVNVDDWSAS